MDSKSMVNIRFASPASTVKNNRYLYVFFVGSPAADRKTNGEKP
jgi:hypothetical protein